MTMTHTYACRDLPETEACPGEFTTDTEEELWKMIELHASVAHGDDPAGEEDKAYRATLIKRDGDQRTQGATI